MVECRGTYSRCVNTVEQYASILRVGEVERVEPGQVRAVVSPLHYKGVGAAPLDDQLWDQTAVDVPGNAPPSLACVCVCVCVWCSHAVIRLC